MTRFEQTGIDYLYMASDKEELNRSFSYSCECCCYKGKHLNCDRCGIAFNHSFLLEKLEEMEMRVIHGKGKRVS